MLQDALNCSQITTIKLSDIKFTADPFSVPPPSLMASVNILGILQPVWLFDGSPRYVVDGRQRLHAAQQNNDNKSTLFVRTLTSEHWSKSLAVILRVFLNPNFDKDVLSPTLFEIISEVEQAELEKHQALLQPFFYPTTLKTLELVCKAPTNLIREWTTRKIPLKTLKRIQAFTPDLLNTLAEIDHLNLSNGSWRQVIELSDEIVRRDENDKTVIKACQQAASSIDLVQALAQLRFPMQKKRADGAVRGWQTLNPPKGTELERSTKAEGQHRLTLQFDSLPAFERQIEALRERLTDDDFRGYIGRL